VTGLGDGRGGWRGIDFAGYSIGVYVLFSVMLPILIIIACCCGPLLLSAMGVGADK
jgi:hypothetical protein